MSQEKCMPILQWPKNHQFYCSSRHKRWEKGLSEKWELQCHLPLVWAASGCNGTALPLLTDTGEQVLQKRIHNHWKYHLCHPPLPSPVLPTEETISEDPCQEAARNTWLLTTQHTPGGSWNRKGVILKENMQRMLPLELRGPLAAEPRITFLPAENSQ